MSFLLGDINFSDEALTGPTARGTSMATTIVQYPINRGKPVPHVVGDELTVKHFSFFFDETFCNVAFNKAKLEIAFATKSPLALVPGNGIGFAGIRYIVENLDIEVLQENRSGQPVRIEGHISLLEDPLRGGLFNQLNIIARGRAIARGGLAAVNAVVRR